MAFLSILFERPEEEIQEETVPAPACFGDLLLDQIVAAVTAGREQYRLKPFFFHPLNSVRAIQYRHEIMQELENTSLYEAMRSFAQAMHAMREHRAKADTLHYALQKKRWFLDAVEIYCEAVSGLVQNLSAHGARARGFVALLDYLAAYVNSVRFVSLVEETQTLKAELSAVKYCLHIKGSRITVRHDDGEVDSSAAVDRSFAKFRQGAVKDYQVEYAASPDMNHVEAALLDLVARLHPNLFASLDTYCTVHADYLDQTIARFDREIQFYLAYLEYCAAFRRAGLPFCYPRVSDHSKQVSCYEGFDLALAANLLREKSPIVCNDFKLEGAERIFVVTGPNQGGKTTFARMFGQLHYLASLGCPVPGREAQLFRFDWLFSHFERAESIHNLRSKLEDELVRIHAILRQATPNSIIIMNELFSSTTLSDAIVLGKRILEQIMELDVLCVYVTFVDEFAALSAKTVSVVGTVVPERPELRTYRIERRPPDGLSYALTIARKHRLTYECIKERIKT